MYTIKRAAELTGVAVATLRAWENRYGIVAPHRTESGYRLYDDTALRTISLMSSLVQQGWSPRQAADETHHRMEASTGVPLPFSSEHPSTFTNSSHELNQLDSSDPDDSEFIDAVARIDTDRVSQMLDDHFSRGSFEVVVDDWLMPTLERVGQAWAAGELSVAAEHAASYAVGRRLAAAYEAAANRDDGPRVLVGLPPDVRHELGLLGFAVAARRAGLSTAYVGADLPASDWKDALGAHNAVCAVLSVPRREDLANLTSVVSVIRDAHPRLTVAVGGRYQDQAPRFCRRLGHLIGPAARDLADQLSLDAGLTRGQTTSPS
jgi:methanogenic corrinoid protein MtbC1